MSQYLHNVRAARSRQILECYGDTSLHQNIELQKGDVENDDTLQLTTTGEDVDYETSFKDEYKQLINMMNDQILAIVNV